MFSEQNRVHKFDLKHTYTCRPGPARLVSVQAGLSKIKYSSYNKSIYKFSLFKLISYELYSSNGHLVQLIPNLKSLKLT